MVELLAVIALLAIVMLIAIPTFGSIQDRTNQSIYESKIASVKAAAESYSEETGTMAFDIATLIRQGKLEADNESGEYRNPVDGKDMRCYAVEVRYENMQYYASVHKTDKCLTTQELNDLYGSIKIKAFQENGSPLEPVYIRSSEGDNNSLILSEWYNVPLFLGYELKNSDLESKIEQITWVGDRSITCPQENVSLNDCKYYGSNTLGSVGTVQTMQTTLEMTFRLENGALFRDKAQKQILIDMEEPRVVSIEVSPGSTNQSGKRFEIEMTDGNGSGLKEYKVVKVNSENDPMPICANEDGYKRVDQSKMVEYLDNGWYYTCVRDNASNDNQDSLAQTKRQVSGVDYSQVNGIVFKVENKDENTPMKVKATITVPTSEDKTKLKMCVSNTGHLKDCSWEAFKSEFDWTFPGHADCKNRTIYLSISDEVGNVTNVVSNPYAPHSIAKYDGNGITLSAANAKKSVCYEGSYSIPSATREGYTFNGWFSDKSGGTQLKKTDKVNYDGVRTYYARWTVNQYYLDLNGLLDGTSSGNISGYGTADVVINGKVVSNDVSDYYAQHPYGTTYEIKDVRATTGHTYEKVSSGTLSGKVGAGGKNTAVQLQFKTNSYSVSWNGNGGSVTKNGATSVKYNNKVGTLGTASRTGYKLEGWYTAASGGSKISADTKITGNTTFYAHWTADKFSITYNANGGSGSMAKQEANNGSTITLSSNKFTHSSKVFAGWATSAGGGVVYKNQSSVKLTSNLTLYAVWKDSAMYMDGKNLVIESQYVLKDVSYNTFAGGCGDHHESYDARIGIIYGGYKADIHKYSPNGDVHYVVAGNQYKWGGNDYTRLRETYYMLGKWNDPWSTNFDFQTHGGYYDSSASGSKEISPIYYYTNSYQKVQVADKFNYSYALNILSCNHNDLNSSVARKCDLSVIFKGVLENYDTSKGYPTGIGMHVYESAEVGGGDGSDGGHYYCYVTHSHRDLNLS